MRKSRTGISKGALVKAALDDDSAAEYNIQINEYNATILGMIQDNYEMDKVRKTFTTDERQPWTNYENNGNEYFTIGAVVRSE